MKYFFHILLLMALATGVLSDDILQYDEECKDERGEECKKFAAVDGYCSYQREFMEKNCRKSCGFCKQPHPGLAESCEDARSSTCQTYAKRPDLKQYCTKYRSYMEKTCKKTCGFCASPPSKAPAPPKEEPCEDARGSACAPYAKRPNLKQYCAQYKSYMEKNCRKTCGFCVSPPTKPPAPPKEECFDKADTRLCQSYASKSGYCKINEDFMRKNCELSCKFCTPLIPPTKPGPLPEECVNVLGDAQCKEYAAKPGYCKENDAFMRINCRKACNFCKPPHPGLPERPYCQDMAKDCAELKAKGHCHGTKEQVNHMKTYCEVTCDICKPPAPADCKDKVDCTDYDKNKMCESKAALVRRHMKEFCPLTCRFCSPKPPSPTSEPAETEPTTGKPATEKPTTAKPTTAKPTTEKPTTAEPTTVKPTTAKPTTLKPTTARPTTVKPTKAAFADTCLERINGLRAIHGMPALRWDMSLQEAANVWAQHLDTSRKSYPDPNNKLQGESLYFNAEGNNKDTCIEAVMSWYDQMDKFVRRGYCRRPPSQATHDIADFVQLIWRNTKTIGIATSGKYLVARYAPRGNVRGQVRANVACPELP